MSNRTCLAMLFIATATLTQHAAAAAADEGHTERTVRFKELDKSGDSKISLVEFQTRPSHADVVAGRVTPPPSDKELTDRAVRFKQLDLDKDGFLSFPEFEATMTTPQPGSAK